MIQRFVQGQDLRSLTAQLNALVDACNAFQAMSGGGLAEVRHTPAGCTVNVDPNAVAQHAPGTAYMSDYSATGGGFIGAGVVPIGGILLWSGSVATIPTHWQLCNGTNGTPDLRNRFVLGAVSDSGTAPRVGDTGGSHDTGAHGNHVVGDHYHGLDTAVQAGSGAYGGDVDNADTSLGGGFTVGHTNDHGGTGANRPAFYSLAYIMRLS